MKQVRDGQEGPDLVRWQLVDVMADNPFIRPMADDCCIGAQSRPKDDEIHRLHERG
jgi:hypothetical protein